MALGPDFAFFGHPYQNLFFSFWVFWVFFRREGDLGPRRGAQDHLSPTSTAPVVPRNVPKAPLGLPKGPQKATASTPVVLAVNVTRLGGTDLGRHWEQILPFLDPPGHPYQNLFFLGGYFFVEKGCPGPSLADQHSTRRP